MLVILAAKYSVLDYQRPKQKAQTKLTQNTRSTRHEVALGLFKLTPVGLNTKKAACPDEKQYLRMKLVADHINIRTQLGKALNCYLGGTTSQDLFVLAAEAGFAQKAEHLLTEYKDSSLALM